MRATKLYFAVLIGMTTFMSTCMSVARDWRACRDCKRVASVLEVEAAGLELQPLHSDDLIGEVRPRRRMMHTRSEPEISEMLDSLCENEKIAHDAAVQKVCKRLIPDYRDYLENWIYSEGQADILHVLCTKLAGLCSPHELQDTAGEL